MDVREKSSNEKRLIDANSAKLAVIDYKIFRCQLGGLMDVAEFIDDRPTIDAVEVVRCKDCKYLMFSDCYGECGKGHMGIVSPYDFCSYGERKEGVD